MVYRTLGRNHVSFYHRVVLHDELLAICTTGEGDVRSCRDQLSRSIGLCLMSITYNIECTLSETVFACGRNSVVQVFLCFANGESPVRDFDLWEGPSVD